MVNKPNIIAIRINLVLTSWTKPGSGDDYDVTMGRPILISPFFIIFADFYVYESLHVAANVY